MRRRTLIGGSLATAALGAFPTAAQAALPGGMPQYRYLRDALTLPLRYNPTGEFIFPCIRGVAGLIASPRAKFYLYYAPHEAPGGISVAFGNTLDGPFTEYTQNPLIDNNLPPVVSHVSSPHVIRDSATQQFFCYFHGENYTTRVARSADGVNFRDPTPILSTRLISGTTETSYARVFEHALSGRGNKYVMVFMGVRAGRRRIFYGWSPNGWDQWQFSQTPLVDPEPDGCTDISGASLVSRNGTTYVAYHGNDGKMHVTDVGNEFDRQNHLGVFYSPIASDNGRAAAPSFGSENGVRYMFYEAGPRLSSRICIAREV
jgi:hypothetical protein